MDLKGGKGFGNDETGKYRTLPSGPACFGFIPLENIAPYPDAGHEEARSGRKASVTSRCCPQRITGDF